VAGDKAGDPGGGEHSEAEAAAEDGGGRGGGAGGAGGGLYGAGHQEPAAEDLPDDYELDRLRGLRAQADQEQRGRRPGAGGGGDVP